VAEGVCWRALIKGCACGDPALVEGRLTGEERSACPGVLLNESRRFGMSADFTIRCWFVTFPN